MSHKKKVKPMDESQVGDNEQGELRAKLVAAIEKAKDVKTGTTYVRAPTNCINLRTESRLISCEIITIPGGVIRMWML